MGEIQARMIGSRSLREITLKMVFPCDLTPVNREELHSIIDKLIDESLGTTAEEGAAKSSIGIVEEAITKGTELIEKGKELIEMGAAFALMGNTDVQDHEVDEQELDDEEEEEVDQLQPPSKKSKSAPN